MQYQENLTLRLQPIYHVDFLYHAKPDLLCGVTNEEGEIAPSIGVALTQHARWLPYLRLYPTTGCLAIGAVGSGWQFTITADNGEARAQRAQLALTIGPYVF